MDIGTEPAATSKGSRMFTEKEIQYLKSQRLARIATASVSSEKEDKKGIIQPDIAPGRSYVDKAKTLLDYWSILYDDTGITLDDIKNMRNNITHKRYYSKEGELGLTEVIKMYKGLMTILTRVFLAMLGYDKYYQDPFMEGKWIHFPSVCGRPDHPGLGQSRQSEH